MKKIFIYNYINEESIDLVAKLKAMLLNEDFEVQEKFSADTDMVIVVGGDGCFLKALKAINFASVPILGINTGHLGFFTELQAEEIEEAVQLCKTGYFMVQKHKSIETIVYAADGEHVITPALNDVLVRKNSYGRLIHLGVSIGDNFIENFSGDGILISSSAGSTAYNYALGGSIVDPALNLLQITPMAPGNNTAYRSFTSSLLLPGSQEIRIKPLEANDTIIVVDGEDNIVRDIKEISIRLAQTDIQIVRRKGYSFWSKVKSKFL